jgi:hypothetical protein
MDRLKRGILYAALLAAPFSEAAEIACRVQGRARCDCPAPFTLDCEGYSRNPVDVPGDYAPSHITVVLGTGEKAREVEVKNPGVSLEALYGERLDLKKALKYALMEAGISVGPDEPVTWDNENVKFPEGTAFYEADGSERSLAEMRRAVPDAELKCQYLGSPFIMETASCGGKKLCVSEATCRGHKRMVACLARGPEGDHCPSADRCEGEAGLTVTAVAEFSADFDSHQAPGQRRCRYLSPPPPVLISSERWCGKAAILAARVLCTNYGSTTVGCAAEAKQPPTASACLADPSVSVVAAKILDESAADPHADSGTKGRKTH